MTAAMASRAAALNMMQDAEEARRKAERSNQALRVSEEKYRSLVENIELGISLVSAGYRVITANAALGRLRGKLTSDCTGRLCFKEFENRDAVCPHCPGAVALRTGKAAETEAFAIRADGSRFPVRLQAFPTFGPDGAPAGFIEIMEDITHQKQTEEQLTQSVKMLRKTIDGTVKAMTSALEMRDPYTAGHERRVAQLANAIAAHMGVPEQQSEGIRLAAYLHDIGKIAVPAEILAKPGKLSQDEFGIIKTHPRFGYDILKEIEFVWPVALVTLQHHERLNGSGYPQGITGDQIIPEARIIAVADVVEAMSSHRPYRPALGAGEALSEITSNKGILYDSAAVEACISLFSDKRFQFG